MSAAVRVVRGEPDDVELAALVAGLAAGGSARAAASAHAAGGDEVRRRAAAQRRWVDAVQRLSDPLVPGPDAWRWSGPR